MSTRYRLHYNRLCEPCRNRADLARRLDWLGRLDVTGESPAEGPVPAGRVAVRDLRTGRLFRGGEAMYRIFRSVPAYWPFAAAFAIPALRRRLGG